MRKFLALLLTLALCVGLMPTALAESSAPAEGIYFAAENGAPAGDVTVGSRPDKNSPWGYWNVPYDSSSEKVIYYYNANAEFLSLAGKPDGLYVYIENAGDHFWKVTLRAPEGGYGDFTVDFNIAENNGFPVSFADTYEPTYDVGLYYRPLRVNEGPGIEKPSVSESDGSFSNAPITLPPYVNRADLAFYFYDGAEFTPVAVTASKGLAIDLFDVNQHTDRYDGADGKAGWYMIMAYDFTVGHLEYRHSDGKTYKLQFKSNFLPDFAFYAQAAASTGHYRMYQVMEPCADGEYKYRTTLYLKSSNSSFNGFTADGLSVSCGQQLYDERGFMVDWVDENGEGHYFKPMERGVDYDYALEASPDGKTLAVTLWANESDLNFDLNKWDGDSWLWGAYVNLLAADESSPLAFNLANQGEFESAKFMPAHLFKQLRGKSIKLTQPGYSGSLTLDGDAVNTVIANSVDTYNEETGEGSITGVSLSMASYEGATEDHKTAIAVIAGEDAAALLTLNFDISLPDGQLGGDATVSHVLSGDSVPDGTEVKVYYVDENGVATLIDNAVYEDGFLTFTTDHFSSYVAVAESADPPLPPSPPAPPAGDSEPDTPSAPTFSDVAEDHWAKAAIDFAAQKGYIQGNVDGTFAPSANISRQQIWMILSRVAGGEAANMAQAKVWAVENGISDGSAPGASVTRQQLVALLYRYAQLAGVDVSVGEDTNILSYDDAFDVAEYAIPAFQWACGAGIIHGTTDSTLSPLGTATRAQFAVMLQRFAALCE